MSACRTVNLWRLPVGSQTNSSQLPSGEELGRTTQTVNYVADTSARGRPKRRGVISGWFVPQIFHFHDM